MMRETAEQQNGKLMMGGGPMGGDSRPGSGQTANDAAKGAAQAGAQLLVVEDPGEARQDRDVLVRCRGEADDEPGRFLAPRDPGRELDHCETGSQDRTLGLARPVG